MQQLGPLLEAAELGLAVRIGAICRLFLADAVLQAYRASFTWTLDAATGDVGRDQHVDAAEGLGFSAVRRLIDVELPLAGGPAVGSGYVVAGSSDGFVVALDAATGEERWRFKPEIVGRKRLQDNAARRGLAPVRAIALDGECLREKCEAASISVAAGPARPRPAAPSSWRRWRARGR
mgnify:CR=1 FL=1